MEKHALGSRLKLARAKSGMDQQSVADALGVSRPVIAQMEAGNRTVSALELRALAQLYDRPIESFLESEIPVAAHFRSKNDGHVHVDVQNAILPFIATLTNSIRVQLLPDYDLNPPCTKAEAQTQGTAVAESERRRLNLGMAPIFNIPHLFELQGIKTGYFDFRNEEISGLFINHPDLGLCLVTNSQHGVARTRFSLLHEYGHAVMDRRDTFAISERANAQAVKETRANSFAASFLIPADGLMQVLNAIGKGRPAIEEKVDFNGESASIVRDRASLDDVRVDHGDVVRIARYFGASYQAAAYRLRSLNYIRWSACKDLLAAESPDQEYYEQERQDVSPYHWQV